MTYPPGYGSDNPPLDLDPSFLLNTRPLAGRTVIKLDSPPGMSETGLLHLPANAQGLRTRDTCWTGEVVAMTPRKHKDGRPRIEDYSPGDRVVVLLLLEDIKVGHGIIITRNERIQAKVV